MKVTETTFPSCGTGAEDGIANFQEARRWFASAIKGWPTNYAVWIEAPYHMQLSVLAASKEFGTQAVFYHEPYEKKERDWRVISASMIEREVCVFKIEG